MKLLLLGCALVATCWSQIATRLDIIQNDIGYQMERPATYMVIAPRKIRPAQVIEVFATLMRLEYTEVNIQVSIVKDNIEFTSSVLLFDQVGSRMMQLQMPANAQPGNYRIRIRGYVPSETSDTALGYVFFNETDIDFEPKQATVFIQLSKPIYRQGQTVKFRVIPILPNLLPKYGSMTIYVNDPTGFAVRRWIGLQTNAGGIVSQEFELSDQPNHGNWSILVDAFGYQYTKMFQVEEYWDPRFDVNVTVQPYIMDNFDVVRGVILANITTGKYVEGEATVSLTIVPSPDSQYYNKDRSMMQNYPKITTFYDYFKGRIDFEFQRDMILSKARETWGDYMRDNFENFDFVFNVTVKDWFFNMTQEAFASTIVFNSEVKLRWVGDPIRTFKPETRFVATVAVMKYDGTPVTTTEQKVRVIPTVSYGATGRGAQITVQEKSPLNGFATFDFPVDKSVQRIELIAEYDNDQRTRQTLMATRFYSISDSYISISTSTQHPQVNQYMIFHLKTSQYVPKLFYQIVSGGNIIIGDELEMTSRLKTFAIALSREMIPQARLVVYYIQWAPEEIVVDTLNFFVNGTRSNNVTVRVNVGKDFTRDSIEINAWADPGSYFALAAMPNDLYSRGLNDGLTENILIDELITYDEPARGSYRHLWRLSETEYEYKFFSAGGYGIDTNTTFRDAGLLVLSDMPVHRLAHACDFEMEMLPCFDGVTCYHVNRTCDGHIDCQQDGADEQGCAVEDPRYNNRTTGMINRVSRVLRFYEDSAWAWKEYFIKPDSRIDFRVHVPKYPLTWVLNGISMSRELGLGLMQKPIKYDATRYMYIMVEAPEYIIRGEQVGVRVTVFNYWYHDDFIEVLVTMEGSKEYDAVIVGEMGIVSSYNPETHNGDHQTVVFLEPGEAKDIFMPIVPTIIQGEFEFTVSAWCFIERDSVTRKIYVKPDGVMNYYHTPYLIDMITFGSIIIPDLDVPVPDQFVVPETREHLYVPYSPTAILSLFGDVVTPGFFQEYLTAEDIMYRPYGAGEMNMFNFAYNLYTLKFKKANQQLDNPTLLRTLKYMNIGLQRQLSYMHVNGSFRMFRDDPKPSIWLSAFVAKTLHEARFGEWERDLFIPLELINQVVVWLCSQQNETGAFYGTETPVYDRKFGSIHQMKTQKMFAHPVPLTAYVLIALYKITDVSGDAVSCIGTARDAAARYLAQEAFMIERSDEIFHLAISAYALSLSQQRSRTMFTSLWSRRRSGEETYFADKDVPPNPSKFLNTVRYLLPRMELMNDAYSVQSTAYALMAHINNNGSGMGQTKVERDSMMRWLQTMRNYIGGFASTQDTLVAMEALTAFTQVDPSRNVYDMQVQLESSASPDWRYYMMMTKQNYTTLQKTMMSKVFGNVRVSALGTGRALMQMTTTKNVEYTWLLKDTEQQIKFYNLVVDDIRFIGRNMSTIQMMPCISWAYTERSMETGLTVLEIDLPSGYVAMNNTLREYVKSGKVQNLKRAEMYYKKIVFYFDYLDTSKTCVSFRADRWYPVANVTIQYKIRVYDYYEPGMHNTTMYTAYSLFNLNICYVCGSYQCPYCPYFNVATVIKASFTLLSLIAGFFLKRYLLRIT